MIRFTPRPGQSAPILQLHDALCRCTECYEKNKDKPRPDITIVPWAPLSDKARLEPEPCATLSYGGVTVEIPLTFLHSMPGCFERSSSYRESGRIVESALYEIETRMWNDLKAKKDQRA